MEETEGNGEGEDKCQHQRAPTDKRGENLSAHDPLAKGGREKQPREKQKEKKKNNNIGNERRKRKE